MRPTHRAGFTFIEIMVVIAVISVLLAIAITSAGRLRAATNEVAVINNLRTLVASLEAYRTVNSAYPATVGLNFRNSMYGANCLAATAPVPDFGPLSFCRVLDGTNPASVVQSYDYTYQAPVGGVTYQILARPLTANVSGTRSFYVNNTGITRHCTTNPRSATMNGMGVGPPPDNPITQGPTSPCN